MKKAYQIIDVILALGLIFAVVVVGRGGGNDTNELKVKNGTTKCGSITKSSSGKIICNSPNWGQ
jgi:hypothetical protein